jgi:hypothetical protein
MKCFPLRTPLSGMSSFAWSNLGSRISSINLKIKNIFNAIIESFSRRGTQAKTKLNLLARKGKKATASNLRGCDKSNDTIHVFINGICQTKTKLDKYEKWFEDNVPEDESFIFVRNISNGLILDVIRSLYLNCGGSNHCTDITKDIIEKNPNSEIIFYCHSEGSLVLKSALKELPLDDSTKKKITIHGFGNPYLFEKKDAENVYNHVQTGDLIPLFFNPKKIVDYAKAWWHFLDIRNDGNRRAIVVEGKNSSIYFRQSTSLEIFKEHSFNESSYILDFSNKIREKTNH